MNICIGLSIVFISSKHTDKARCKTTCKTDALSDFQMTGALKKEERPTNKSVVKQGEIRILLLAVDSSAATGDQNHYM